ncbi:tetratricopeptide repeat protein [Flavobacterium sp.]|jgi:tetratricopeptide (TPR) repeat protein|uniref:tetratricopeptide repeat protein n=1 Tax=Flavobacterium sp. TaxID=239 RepID=UPI003BCE4E13
MQFTNFFIFFLTSLFYGTADFEKAEKLYQQEKWDEAKVLFQQCLKENPKDFKSIEYLGDIAGHQKKWDEAIKYYKSLKIQFPKTASYFYKYGGAFGMKAKSVNKFKALGMISEIEDSFLMAAKLDPKHTECRWALVMFYIQLPRIIGGSEAKAQKYSNELMAISKVDGYLSKGYIDEYYERFSDAEKDYSKAHEIGNSKITFQKLYNLYLNKIKDSVKAKRLKEQFEK